MQRAELLLWNPEIQVSVVGENEQVHGALFLTLLHQSARDTGCCDIRRDNPSNRPTRKLCSSEGYEVLYFLRVCVIQNHAILTGQHVHVGQSTGYKKTPEAPTSC